MEFRRLIEFGKSSFVISVPKGWITKNKLKKGDVLHIDERDNELVILPESSSEGKEKKSSEIDITGMNIKDIEAQIISRYIKNYNSIILKGDDLRQKAPQIREVIHNLMALEIMEETATRIVANDFLNMADLSIKNLLRKMDIITREMMLDAKQCINENKCENISDRDQDVNRLSYLIFRSIKYYHENPNMLRKAKLTHSELIDFWLVTFAVENIADQIKRIAKHIAEIKLDAKAEKKIIELCEKIQKRYMDAMKTFYTRDTKAAYSMLTGKAELILELKNIHDSCKSTESIDRILEKLKQIVGVTQQIVKVVYNSEETITP